MNEMLTNFATKASAVALNLNLLLLGQPVHTPINYESLMKSSYQRSVWVYACVRAISEAAASVPLVLYRQTANGIEEVETHPILDLLNNPNPETTMIQYRQNVIAFLLLTGNSYEEIVYAAKRPRELYTWRPDRTSLIPGNEGIDKVRYTVNGMEKDLDYTFIIHHKMFNALDDFYGLSPLQVARVSVDLDNGTQDWNTSVMQNSGVPSGILVSPQEVKLSDVERKRAQRFLRRMFSGIRNAGKPQLLENGMQWVQLGITPKDMDFVQSRKMTREEICAVYRTPPQIVGIQDKSTYSNYAEARGAFYTDSVLPTLDRLVAGYNHKLLPLFGETDLFIGYDRDAIEALQENADKKFSRINNAKDLTINEKREALGYGRVKDADVIFVQVGMTVVPLGPDANKYAYLTEIPAPSTTSGESSITQGNEVVSDDNAIKAFENILSDLEVKTSEKKWIERINKKRDDYSKVIAKRYIALLAADCKRVEKALGKFKTLNANNQTKVTMAVESAIKSGIKKWETTITASMLLVTDDFAKMAFTDVKKQEKTSSLRIEKKEDDDELTSELEELAQIALILEHVSEIEELNEHFQTFMAIYAAAEVRFVSNATIASLSTLIGNSIRDGLTITDLAKQMMSMHFFSERRAYKIARAEVLSASSYANRQGARAVGASMDKKWIAASDKRTRDTHEKVDGQTVDIDSFYTVGTSKAMYPGDPALPAKERIYCRCAERFIVKRSEKV